ncbi:MAG TPA: pilus assembly protein N-terminal domain-containing protein [Polyangiaceae bacterium]
MFARRLALFILALALDVRGGESKAESVELELGVGEQRVLATDGVRSYSEGVPGVVDVRLTKDARQFVVVGQHPGATSLLFMLEGGAERQYRIVVSNSETRAPESSGPSDKSDEVLLRDNVRLDFYFVELSATATDRVGMTWPASLGGGQLGASFDLLHGSFDSATAVVTNQALPRLDLAASSGFAKILRQAAVITANGTEASFSGGGEVNLRVQGTLAAEIRSIEFGSTVKVLPRYDRQNGRIELTLTADVSDLTDDNGTGAPGRSKASLHTIVNLELGQSLVLAGLTARSEARSRSGLPVLSDIPILGILFGSTAHRRQDSENVIFIVPTVVDAISVVAAERVREALETYEKYEGELRDVRLVDEPVFPKPRRPKP